MESIDVGSRLPHLAQRLFNTPLALLPGKGEVILAALADRFGVSKIFGRPGAESLALAEGFAMDRSSGRNYEVGYDIVAGIAIIPIMGTLVAKLGTLRPLSGMTGYDGIRANISMALDDDEVQGIMLDIDSPGGEVSGCFDLVDAIYQARGDKPIWAILSESAYSAAYAIASAADRIIVPRTGGTGSVGVICMHADFSKALDKEGIKVTMIQYGEKKAYGNEYLPLSADALAILQADIDAMGGLFVETVARNRRISARSVRNTQARTYLGAAGVEIGFADAVMAPDEAFRSMAAKISAADR